MNEFSYQNGIFTDEINWFSSFSTTVISTGNEKTSFSQYSLWMFIVVAFCSGTNKTPLWKTSVCSAFFLQVVELQCTLTTGVHPDKWQITTTDYQSIRKLHWISPIRFLFLLWMHFFKLCGSDRSQVGVQIWLGRDGRITSAQLDSVQHPSAYKGNTLRQQITVRSHCSIYIFEH